MLKKVALAVAAALAAQAASAGSIDFHGYIRSQVGTTSKGGNLQCFQLAYPAVGKYRLGNECDNYSELAFGTKLYKGNDGVWANYNLRLALRELGGQDFEGSVQQDSGKGNFQVVSRENFVEAGGFFGGNVLGGSKIWLGKRFYNRNDVMLNDIYYWANTGEGAGIEDVKFGPVKFAYAYHQYGGNSSLDGGSGDFVFDNGGYTGDRTSVKAVHMHEFRLYDIPLWKNGKLETALELFNASVVDKPGNAADEGAGSRDGTRLILQLTQGDFFGGFNKFAVLFGRRAGAGLTWQPAYPKAIDGENEERKSTQIVEQFYVSQGIFSLMGTVQWMRDDQKDNNNEGYPNSRTYWSFGFRPQVQITENFSLVSELSHEVTVRDVPPGWIGRTPEDGKESAKLDKITVAAQLQAGRGFWARPVFRLFGTYAKWNEDAANSNWSSNGSVVGKANGIYADTDHGFTYGAQVEAWW